MKLGVSACYVSAGQYPEFYIKSTVYNRHLYKTFQAEKNSVNFSQVMKFVQSSDKCYLGTRGVDFHSIVPKRSLVTELHVTSFVKEAAKVSPLNLGIIIYVTE